MTKFECKKCGQWCYNGDCSCRFERSLAIACWAIAFVILAAVMLILSAVSWLLTNEQ